MAAADRAEGGQVEPVLGGVLFGISGFRLSFRAVHGPEQIGEMGRVGGKHLPDRFASSLGSL